MKTTDLKTRSVAEITADLIRVAHEKHAQYPQYNGYFDGWVLVWITRRTRFKGGHLFERGDLTIAQPNVEPCEYYPHGMRRVYNVKGNFVGQVDAARVRPVV